MDNPMSFNNSHPKFIIEQGELKIGKCTYHKELAKDPSDKTIRGGWFFYNRTDNSFLLYGSSYDYGAATKEMIQECIENGKVTNGRGRDYLKRHSFKYAVDLGMPEEILHKHIEQDETN